MTPVKTSSPLRNIGDSCYVNAPIQILFQVQDLFQTLPQSKHPHVTQADLFECLSCGMGDLLTLMSIAREDPVTPMAILTAITKLGSNNARDLYVGRQCDAWALTSFLVEKCKLMEFSRKFSIVSNDRGGGKSDDVDQIHESFCFEISLSTEPSLDQTTQEVLNEYLQSQGGRNSMEVIIEEPKLIWMYLKRFYQVTELQKHGRKATRVTRQNKLMNRIVVSDEIQMVTANGKVVKYDILGTVNHEGSDISGGHYTTMLRTASGWDKMDDTIIHAHKIENKPSDVYLLFYKLRSDSTDEMARRCNSTPSINEGHVLFTESPSPQPFIEDQGVEYDISGIHDSRRGDDEMEDDEMEDDEIEDHEIEDDEMEDDEMEDDEMEDDGMEDDGIEDAGIEDDGIEDDVMDREETDEDEMEEDEDLSLMTSVAEDNDCLDEDIGDKRGDLEFELTMHLDESRATSIKRKWMVLMFIPKTVVGDTFKKKFNNLGKNLAPHCTHRVPYTITYDTDPFAEQLLADPAYVQTFICYKMRIRKAPGLKKINVWLGDLFIAHILHTRYVPRKNGVKFEFLFRWKNVCIVSRILIREYKSALKYAKNIVSSIRDKPLFVLSKELSNMVSDDDYYVLNVNEMEPVAFMEETALHSWMEAFSLRWNRSPVLKIHPLYPLYHFENREDSTTNLLAAVESIERALDASHLLQRDRTVYVILIVTAHDYTQTRDYELPQHYCNHSATFQPYVGVTFEENYRAAHFRFTAKKRPSSISKSLRRNSVAYLIFSRKFTNRVAPFVEAAWIEMLRLTAIRNDLIETPVRLITGNCQRESTCYFNSKIRVHKEIIDFVRNGRNLFTFMNGPEDELVEGGLLAKCYEVTDEKEIIIRKRSMLPLAYFGDLEF